MQHIGRFINIELTEMAKLSEAREVVLATLIL